MFATRASRRLVSTELTLAPLVFATEVCGAFTPKTVLCICVDFRFVHVASFVVVLCSRFTLYADVSMKITRRSEGDGRVVSGVTLEEKLYTRQLHLHPSPPAVSPLRSTDKSCLVMPAVNGHTQHTHIHNYPRYSSQT